MAKQRTSPFVSALGVIVAILLLGCCFISGLVPPGIDALVYLPFAWVVFLVRVVPQVQVRWDLAASGLAYAAILLGLSHYFLRWLYRELKQERWRWSWTLAGLAILLLMFIAGTAAIGVVHQATWLARSPAPLYRPGPGPRADRVKCASNLRQIGQALMLYAYDHGGQYPDDFTALIRNDLSPETLVCPSSNDDPAEGATLEEVLRKLREPHHCSYRYFGKGPYEPVDPDRIIALELLDNHADGINVLFGDGHVDWYSAPQAREMIQRATAPQTRPTSGPAVSPPAP